MDADINQTMFSCKISVELFKEKVSMKDTNRYSLGVHEDNPRGIYTLRCVLETAYHILGPQDVRDIIRNLYHRVLPELKIFLQLQST